MRLSSLLPSVAIALFTAHSVSAASWTYAEATLTVQSKGAGIGGSQKDSFSPSKPLSKPVNLGPSDNLKIVLTTQEGKASKKPHQAFLLLQDSSSDLDVSYPLSVKDSGKAKLELTTKDLPTQFTRSQAKLTASLLIASFGASTGYNSRAFTLNIVSEDGTGSDSNDKSLRYGQLPEIHHIFRPDQKSPNVLISLVFSLASIATVPLLLGAWLFLGGNANHLSKAMSDAPVAHALFVGSVIALEGVLFLYYTVWNLFQTLPALFVLGMVAFVSGSRALTEVQDRRLAGLR